MNLTNSILATVQFELMRVMKLQRLSVTLVMTLFPPLMIWLLSASGVLEMPEFVISVLCGMICLLSLLLWATPNVYAELEGKSWTFVTTRPNGRWSILFGKFLISMFWSFSVAWFALTTSMFFVEPAAYFSEASPIRIWLVFTILLALASMVYSAVFSFLGVVIQKRAMVVAVGYFFVFECVLAAIPANVGKITMSYHLFSLMIKWLGWIVPDDELSAQSFGELYGWFPWWFHVSAIFVMTIAMLYASAIVIRSREYITVDESSV